MRRLMIKLLLAAALCLLMLSSCSGSVKAKTVQAKAMFTNEPLTLTLTAKDADLQNIGEPGNYGYMWFSTCFWEREIVEKIRLADPTLTCVLDGGCILISRDNAQGAKDYFWMTGIVGQSYYFGGMRAGLITDVAETGDQVQAVLFPYHLESDSRLKNGFTSFYINAEYETTAGAEEFYQFYADSGWYDVELKDGCVLLNGYKHPDAVMENPADAERYGTLKFDRKLKIQFREFADQRYFQFVFAEESDTK